MGERLNWNEIKEKYPSMHIGLVDVVLEEDGMNIKSAVVKYTEKEISDGQLMLMAKKGEIIRRYTALEDSILLLGGGQNG